MYLLRLERIGSYRAISSFAFGGVRTDLHSRIKSEVQEQLSPQPDLRRVAKGRDMGGISGTLQFNTLVPWF